MMFLWSMATLSRLLLLQTALLSLQKSLQQNNEGRWIGTSTSTTGSDRSASTGTLSVVVHAHSPHTSTSLTNHNNDNNNSYNHRHFGRRCRSSTENDRYVQPLGRMSFPQGAPHWLLASLSSQMQSVCQSTLGHLVVKVKRSISSSKGVMVTSVVASKSGPILVPVVTSCSMNNDSTEDDTTNDSDSDSSWATSVSIKNIDQHQSTSSSSQSFAKWGRQTIGPIDDEDDILHSDREQQQHEQTQHDRIDVGRRNARPTEYILPSLSSSSSSIESMQEVIRIKVQRPKSYRTTTHNKQPATTTTTTKTAAYIESLTQPLMTERVWRQLTGNEWCGGTSTTDRGDVGDDDETASLRVHGQLLDSLAEMGEAVARIDTPTPWIDWHIHSSSSKDKIDHLDSDLVQVWTGKCIATPPPHTKNFNMDDDNHHSEHSAGDGEEKYYGIQVPFIKTRAILPHSVSDMVDLMLDSNKVVTYNPWSLGRKDCWIDCTTTKGGGDTTAITKIVQNRVQPPIPGARPIVSTTLLHARPIRTTIDNVNDDATNQSWIIVSRSVGNNHTFMDENDQKMKTSRSDILLGVNLLEPIRSSHNGSNISNNNNMCMITTVTHVYSPSVPVALAERLGVQSSVKFIQDIRNLPTKTAVLCQR